MHTGPMEMSHSPLEYLYAQFTRYIEDGGPRLAMT